MFGGILSPRFLTSYWSAGVGDISSGMGPCFPLAGGLLRQSRRKMTNTTRTTLSATQTANQSTFINAILYSTVISKNDKNEQITLLSQHKLA
jgi:hypothetical protein